MKLLRNTYYIPEGVLEETRRFLFQRGTQGCEGMALWIGVPSEESTHIRITRVLIPEQVCIQTNIGIAVMLTNEAHYTLTDHLEAGELFYVRIHSHPDKAYHSTLDDENTILTHEGALSIVVPDFAKRPIKLEKCAIYGLVFGVGWVALPSSEINHIFEVTA